MPRRLVHALAGPVLLVATAASLAATAPPKADIGRQIRFGTEMALQGNWREALFRWQRAVALDPTNPRLHNNLAVAFESIGEFDKADAEYRAAIASEHAPAEVRQNYDLFLKFYERFKEGALVPEPDEEKAAAPDAKAP